MLSYLKNVYNKNSPLERLSDDIIGIIISYLDTKSVANLHLTCKFVTQAVFNNFGGNVALGFVSTQSIAPLLESAEKFKSAYFTFNIAPSSGADDINAVCTQCKHLHRIQFQAHSDFAWSEYSNIDTLVLCYSKSSRIQNVVGLRDLTVRFCDAGENLSIKHVPHMELLYVNTCLTMENCTVAYAPVLSHLHISHCRSLRTLELLHADKLYSIELINCPYLSTLDVTKLPLLCTLKINYSMSFSALTLTTANTLTNLQLYECNAIEHLPLQSLHCVQNIKLINCKKIQDVDVSHCVLLHSLVIKNCPVQTLHVCNLSHLHNLKIVSCTYLSSLLTSRLPQLHTLLIANSIVTKVNIQDSPKLTTLCLKKCNNLVELSLHRDVQCKRVEMIHCSPEITHTVTPNLQLVKSLTLTCSVRNVYIINLSKLTHLTQLKLGCRVHTDAKSLSSLTSLTSLSLSKHNTCLYQFNNLTRLQTLKLHRCKTHSDLSLHKLSCLTTLKFDKCMSLTALNLCAQTQLERLHIASCNYLRTVYLPEHANVSVYIYDCFHFENMISV